MISRGQRQIGAIYLSDLKLGMSVIHFKSPSENSKIISAGNRYIIALSIKDIRAVSYLLITRQKLGMNCGVVNWLPFVVGVKQWSPYLRLVYLMKLDGNHHDDANQMIMHMPDNTDNTNKYCTDNNRSSPSLYIKMVSNSIALQPWWRMSHNIHTEHIMKCEGAIAIAMYHS